MASPLIEKIVRKTRPAVLVVPPGKILRISRRPAGAFGPGEALSPL